MVGKIVELVGSSDKSFEDAVAVAVKRTAKTVRGVRGVKVESFNATVDSSGKIKEYRATVKISFQVDA